MRRRSAVADLRAFSHSSSARALAVLGFAVLESGVAYKTPRLEAASNCEQTSTKR